MSKITAVIFAGIMTAIMNCPFSASAANGPQCFVTVKVIDVGVEEPEIDTGKERKQYYLDLFVENIQSSDLCNVFEGNVYRVTDNYPGSVRKNQIIFAGVTLSSTMGPEGVMPYLIWSPLKDQNGDVIKDKNKKFEIGHMQGSDRPISGKSADK